MEFRANRFSIYCRVRGNILLNEHKGAALRGAFNDAVREFCQRPDLTSCHLCALVRLCPVSQLVSPVEEAGRRGPDVPRPYTIQPPLGPRERYEDGSPFTFGITLYGRGIRQLSVILGGVHARGSVPLGRRVQQPSGLFGRGLLYVEAVTACDLVNGRETVVMRREDQFAHMPDFGVTHEAVLKRAESLGDLGRLSIEFLTPTRLIEQGRLVQRPLMRPLVQRLVERISSLWEHYGEGSPPLDFPVLMAAAEEVRTVEDSTRWVDLESYSARRDARTPIGGFAGTAVFEGPLTPLLPWLIWGEYTHVGKNAVKGDGWYRIEGMGDGRGLRVED